MLPGSDYAALDATALAALVRKGETTPAELLEAAIDRAAEVNPQLNAIVIDLHDAAREAIAAGLPAGPLHGVPFLLKDLHAHFAGAPLTNGCRLFRDFVADHDSELVARYRRAGLVIFGRTASPEFGLTTSTESVLYGPTRSPWSPRHIAGGSSGGAAAAVAAGIVPAAHASDGGGSIRIPASCCGVFGLKPTRARNPAGPDVGEGWSGMSTAHVVSRTVRDSALLLDTTQGPDLGDPYWAPPPERPYVEEAGREPGRLRIALQTQAFNEAETHADCVEAARDAADLCASLDHDVEAARLRVDREALAEATRVIIGANLLAQLEDRARVLGRDFTAEDVETLTLRSAERARTVDSAEYARAIRVIHGVGRQVARFLEGYDVLLSPTMATPPLELGTLALTNPDMEALLSNLMRTVGFTQLFNAAGNPAMSVPLWWNGEGLPIGVQFAGRFGDEATLLRLAAQLESARPWSERRPPLG